jgi:hypothetical protein
VDQRALTVGTHAVVAGSETFLRRVRRTLTRLLFHRVHLPARDKKRAGFRDLRNTECQRGKQSIRGDNSLTNGWFPLRTIGLRVAA